MTFLYSEGSAETPPSDVWVLLFNDYEVRAKCLDCVHLIVNKNVSRCLYVLVDGRGEQLHLYLAIYDVSVNLNLLLFLDGSEFSV